MTFPPGNLISALIYSKTVFSHFIFRQDINNSESIDLLKSCGVNFEQHAKQGIDPVRFGELFTMSGLVLNSSITWITFQGLIDIAFLLRILTGCDLPEMPADFNAILHIFFPQLYDVKVLVEKVPIYAGSLLKIARDLKLKEEKDRFQSAEESRLTVCVFFKIRGLVYKNVIDDKFNGKLFYLQNVYF